MTPFTALLAAALVPFLLTAGPGPAPTTFKCGNRAVSPEAVYVLDAKIVDSAAFVAVPANRIDALLVACSDARFQVFGVEPNRNVVMVFTAPGPYAAGQSALDAVKALQESHLARMGRFAASVAELGWKDSSGLLTVTIAVAPDGNTWSASVDHAWLIDARPTTIAGARSPADNGRP